MDEARQTAAPAAKDQDLARATQDPGPHLTTNQGLRLADDQNTLRAGARGPSLLEDFHFREKITHFDHERIPERVVHARGAAAHGYFQVTEDLSDLTMASLFRDPAKRTPVFVRFSTVAGSRGSADTPRDVRGFAVKFYTDEGVWDLVGNNIPVFFIQDAIKFPDVIHAVKPEPHNEIPQAASAHDTFWDFVSLTPESTHMLMWVMSDRALPRSFAMMEGFGIHSFRLVNAQGQAHFVKFHWKPRKGVHSLLWDEAQKIAGKDPDFNRRDLWEAIEDGDFPEWELGLQVVAEADAGKFPFDLLDPTKIIPEEDVPVRRVGRLVLDRNPDNFFAETEQVAFCPAHVVPGIDFSDDPLLQGRLFSYLDTQISRLGVNFAELPINRPVSAMSNNQRDGKLRHRIDRGRVSYFPNSLAGGCPAHSPDAMAAFRTYAQPVSGQKLRVRSESFADHFSQATLFWNSMSPWEKDHIVDAFSFELNMVGTVAVKQRVLDELLVNVADDLAARVAEKTGLTIQSTRRSQPHQQASPALSMDRPADSIRGRKVAILAAEGVDATQLGAVQTRLHQEGAKTEVIAAVAGSVKAADGSALPVDRPAPNAPSVLYDAVVIPGGAAATALAGMGQALHFVLESFAHGKPVAALGEGAEILKKMSLAPGDGVVTGTDVDKVMHELVLAMKQHRHHGRLTAAVPA
ncbi:catalase II [Rhodovastum atsumiense]|uniref:Catalase n=1 Tax=Rhodovastum atsumiense TaxID=504468 RepID=A0A5M6IUZ8_9PROT|nr:catalase [Rhodovastum atsumiense]KAA5612051.1 catalase [Rhodovastum atsumiense]CAH2604082.1 catalase II [Rhodovastum atsumiense]